MSQMNIHDIWVKCKSFIDSRDVYTVLIIILVGLSSFGLGRLSLFESRREPIRLENFMQNNTENSAPNDTVGNVGNIFKSVDAQKQTAIAKGGMYVASKSGKKYHLPWCAGARTIKPENVIWFNSKADAEKAGYAAASNCKGI